RTPPILVSDRTSAGLLTRSRCKGFRIPESFAALRMLPRAGGQLSPHPHGAANGASDTPRQRRIPCWVGPGTAAVPAAGHDRPRGELETPGRAGLAQRSQRVGIDVGPSGLVAPGWHSQATLGRHPLGGRVTLTRPVGHPQQRDLSQRRVGIATADVAVHACEPHLFDVLVGPWVAGPRGRPERAALLVEAEAERSAPESLPPVDGDPPS